MRSTIGIGRRRGGAFLAALAAILVLPACGSDSPNTPPVTQPPAPVRSLLIQGNFNLGSVSEANAVGLPADVWRHPFQTAGAGVLEVNADWTFGGSQMAVAILRGDCSFNQIYADQCVEEGGVFPSAKPSRFTINNLPAGTYTLVIVNASNVAESGNYQVYLTR